MDLRTEISNRFCNYSIQQLPIRMGSEDCLPMITPEGDMVETSRDMDTKRAGHLSVRLVGCG